MKYHRSRLPKGNLFNYVDKKQAKLKKKATVPQVKAIVSRRIEKQHAMNTIAFLAMTRTMVVGTNCVDLTALAATIAGSAYQAPRTGVRIFNHRLNIRVDFQANAATTYNNVRIIVFKWKPTTATYNPTDQLILGIPHGIQPNNSPMSFPAYNAESQFQILYDRTLQVINATVKQYVSHKFSLFGKNLPRVSNFDNPTTNNGSGHIYMWVMCEEPTANVPNFLYNQEYVYSDA